MLPGKKCTQQDSAKHDDAGNDECDARPAINENQKERQCEIELIFDRERPRVGERSATVETDVLDGKKKFPERLRHLRILAPPGQQKINREHHEIRRHDSQRPAGKEATKTDRLIARERREELATD